MAWSSISIVEQAITELGHKYTIAWVRALSHEETMYGQPRHIVLDDNAQTECKKAIVSLEREVTIKEVIGMESDICDKCLQLSSDPQLQMMYKVRKSRRFYL